MIINFFIGFGYMKDVLLERIELEHFCSIAPALVLMVGFLFLSLIRTIPFLKCSF